MTATYLVAHERKMKLRNKQGKLELGNFSEELLEEWISTICDFFTKYELSLNEGIALLKGSEQFTKYMLTKYLGKCPTCES